MAGKLELLCGPSGSGKSQLDRSSKSYRWTTRDIREGEIDSCEYDGSLTTHGFFVSEDKFQARASRGELVGVHRYPDPEEGNWYGFPKQEIEEALARGEELSEQIVDFEAVQDVVSHFEPLDVKLIKAMILSPLAEIEKRLEHRGGMDIESRKALARETLRVYLDNRSFFNAEGFNFPKMVKGEESNRAIEVMLSELEEGRMPDQMYDSLNNDVQKLIRLSSNGMVQAMLEVYEPLRGSGTALMLNHYGFGLNHALDLKKICYLAFNSDGDLDRPYLNDLGFAFCRWELGDMAGFMEEVIRVAMAFDEFKEGDLSLERREKKILARMFRNPYSLIEKLGRNPDDKELTSKVEGSFRSLYAAVRDFNFYFLIQSSYNVLRDSPLESIRSAVLFNLGLERVLTTQFPFEITADPEKLEKFVRAIERKREYWEGSLVDHYYEDCPELLISEAEFCVLDSLVGQSRRYINLFENANQGAALIGRDPGFQKLVEDLIGPSTSYVDGHKGQLQGTTLANLAVYEHARFLAGINEIVCNRYRADRTTANLAYPLVRDPQDFLQRFWDSRILSLSSLGKIEGQLISLIDQNFKEDDRNT